ncbi:MAG TPA: Lrp/AsnC family transcriptional regulator [Azospirillaceae bacterium]|nr:Lrp/AsnC family transcriptional regulator [Azospirillaceae bacterium]
MTELDRTDVRILEVLQADGRLTNVELAQRVGLSETPCLRRVRRLEQEGVISRYAAMIEARKVGLGLLAFVQITLERHRDADADAFKDAVMSHPEVVACWLMTGAYDFLLQIVAPDMDSYADFVLRHLLRMPGVKDVSSSFALQAVKPPSALPLEHLRGIEGASTR